MDGWIDRGMDRWMVGLIDWLIRLIVEYITTTIIIQTISMTIRRMMPL